MTGQPERIYLMMFSLVNVIGIISGMWWLPAAAHLINAEKFFIQYLHHRKPDLIRLFDCLAAVFRLPISGFSVSGQRAFMVGGRSSSHAWRSR